MASYFVLTEKEAQEAVTNIANWLEVQCSGFWYLATEDTNDTARFLNASAVFGYFLIEMSPVQVRVAKYRPDRATVDYELIVHFEGAPSLERYQSSVFRIKPMLLEAEAYTRHLEATNG